MPGRGGDLDESADAPGVHCCRACLSWCRSTYRPVRISPVRGRSGRTAWCGASGALLGGRAPGRLGGPGGPTVDVGLLQPDGDSPVEVVRVREQAAWPGHRLQLAVALARSTADPVPNQPRGHDPSSAGHIPHPGQDALPRRSPRPVGEVAVVLVGWLLAACVRQ